MESAGAGRHNRHLTAGTLRSTRTVVQSAKGADAAPPRRAGRSRVETAPPFAWRAGVHVPGTGLWCDALRTQDLCFLSSAQVSAAAPRRGGGLGALLCSERTWRFCQVALGLGLKEPPASLLLSPTGRPFQLGALRMELFPSGALPGATSLWLRLPSGKPVVYAGAPNPAPSPLCEPMQLRSAESMVCHAPLALLDAALPSREAAIQSLRDALAEAQAEQALTLVLCPPLGTAPELAHALAGDQAHGLLFGPPQVRRACAAYGELSPALAGKAASIRPIPRHLAEGGLPAGAVLFWPWLPAAQTGSVPIPTRAELGAVGRPVRAILCTGAALLPEAVAACQTQLVQRGLELTCALPYPDALDRLGLLRYVADSEVQRLFLTAGYSDALAKELRARKVTVEPLGPPRQLALLP